MIRARSTALGALLAGALAAGLAVGTPAATSAPPEPAAASAQPVAPVVADEDADLKDRIAALDGVSSVTEVNLEDRPDHAVYAGYRFFQMTFTQPVDHKHPKGDTFEQRITLLHKDIARPW